MSLSLSQILGLVTVVIVIVFALGFGIYEKRRTSFIFHKSLRNVIALSIALLIIQSALLLAVSGSG